MTHLEDREKKDNESYSRNFTRIPNIVFASYKYLSKEEKYLYSQLRFIYWDTKPRYATLRDLHELTGFSIGALSKMLPRLHECGLIHAEIRREKGKDGKEKGNSKYHITILDIWELNRLYFSCSPDEQESMDPSQKLVHQMTQACSPNDTSLFTKSDKPVHEKEQDRAQPERAKKDIKTSLKTSTKERVASVSKTDAVVTSPPVKNPDIALMDTWDDICGERIPRDRKHKEAAAELARCGATREDLINNRDFCLRTNPQWYKKNGVDLAAIARNWGKWKSSLSQSPQQQQQQQKPTSAINPNSNKHLGKYFTEEQITEMDEEELAKMGVN